MPEPIISVQNYTKKFGDRTVVDDLSFEVQKGEIFAFLGANGSGKTTTIRSLLNLMKPTNGKLLINGETFGPHMAPLLGYLPEERGLYVSSTVLETMTYFAELKGMTSAQAKEKAKAYLAQVGLADKIDSQIKRLSSGQQQKIQLGITIINTPQLLILDEPTKGLDPVNRELLMNILLDLNKQGSTVIFITHQMEEVEEIADRLVMIKNGRRVLYGGVNEVRSSFGKNTIHLTYTGNLMSNETLFTAQIRRNEAELTPKPNVSTQEIFRYVGKQDLQIQKFEVAAPSLQEIFVRVSKDDQQ